MRYANKKTMTGALRARVRVGAEALAELQPQWDRLLESSYFDTVFLTHGWLSASRQAYAADKRILIPSVWRDDSLMAVAAFQEQNGIVTFLGSERSDYLALIVSRRLSGNDVAQAITHILDMSARAATQFRRFDLRRIPIDAGAETLLKGQGAFRAIATGQTVAPSMNIDFAPKAVRKKSLVRHERKLQKMGTLTCNTYTSASEIEPRLDDFFDQHIRRWATTPSPSLFNHHVNTEFYRLVVRSLEGTGCLRFTEIRLDDRMVASHFGFCRCGIFTLYKPSFEPELSRYSPGEVLLKRLIERAVDENCIEFDFTIGNEPYKQRFATKTRRVISIALAQSPLELAKIRVRHAARDVLARAKRIASVPK